MRVSIAGLRQGAREVGIARLTLLGTVAVGHVVIHWYQQLFTLVLPSLKSDLHLNNIQVGTLATARQAMSAGLQLPMGYVADSYRWLVPTILASSLVVLGLAYVLLGIAPSYRWALPAAALLSVGTTLWHPAAFGSLSVRFPERRGMALSIHGAGASVGDAIGPVAIGAILLVAAWRWVLIFHFIPALLIAFVLWRSLGRMYQQQEGPKPTFRSYLTGVRGLFSNPQVVAVMAANSLKNMGNIAITTFLPIYIREDLGYSTFILGVYVALLYVLGMISQPIMGITSDRFGRKAILVPSIAIMGLLYFGLAGAKGGIQLGLVISALGFFFYPLATITMAAVFDVASERVHSSASGVIGLVSQPFALVSPVLAGYLATEFGIKTTFFYAGALSLAASAILVPVRFRRADRPRAPAH